MFPNPKPHNKFGENDYVLEQAEIFLLGHTNPIVHLCLTQCQRGDLTYEQALMSMVKFLAYQNKIMFVELVKNQEERIRYPERFYNEK